MVGHGEDQLPAARARHRAPHQRRRRTCWARSTSCSPPAGSAGGLRLRDDHRPGQRPGRARARPEVRPAPGGRDIDNPEHRELRRRRLGHRADETPAAGRRLPTRSSARSTAARSRACCRICFNPVVSLPDNNFIREALEKLEFFVAIDFFLTETARHADVVLPGSLQEEDEGTVTSVEGPRHQDQQGRRSARARRGRTGSIIHDIAQALGPRAAASPSRARARSSTSCASRRRAASPTTPASPTRRSKQQIGVFWPCPRSDGDHPGHARGCSSRVVEPGRQGAGPFYFPDGKARFNVADYRPPAEDVDDEYPIILTTARGQPVPVRHADAAHRPAGRQYPEPRLEIHPRLAAQLGIADGDWVDGRDAPRRRSRCARRS